MRILAIETSCDETAVAVVEAVRETDGSTHFTTLGNALLSQIEIHKEYGGVYPMLAKREHAKNLVPLLEAALSEAQMLHESRQSIPDQVLEDLGRILEREPGLSETFTAVVSTTEPPTIDAIAVTAGPGLEPALWVGVNFARALSRVWDIPLVSVNHMEGHISTALASTANTTYVISPPTLPLLSLLISGGHTELVLSREWLSYELIGQTRDDAVGEAFDKVARMLGLPYPGGPEVSKLAEKARARGGENPFTLPRPMIYDSSFDFSFSGLKTAVLYLVKDKELSEEDRENLALAFEDAAADVLYAKTSHAIEAHGVRTIALGGGVSANTHTRRTFAERLPHDHPGAELCLPGAALTTDNALMIAMAGFFRAEAGEFTDRDNLVAQGNRKLAA